MIVLLHSGVTDSREWEAVRPLLAERRVVVPELWQSRPLVDIVVEAMRDGSAALVGTSLGGRGALEAAAAVPDRVTSVVVINANPFGWSDDVRAIGAEEDALVAAGRLDEAAEVMVRTWLVGPHRREEDVPRELRERVFEMQRRAYELEEPDSGPLDVASIRAPLLFVRGALDWPDVKRAAARFVAEIPDAREAVIDGAAHLPALERPDEVASLLREFLG